MQTDRTVDRYETLDGVRGIAALAVMFGHFGLFLNIFRIHNGFLAVDTFFIMSGFVIAHSYGERLRGGMPAWAYLYRRVVRLYPMFVISLLIGAGILYYGLRNGAIEYKTGTILRGLGLNMLYVPFFNAGYVFSEPGEIFPANPPAWSLFFEMVASGAFLLLFDLRPRMLALASGLWFVVLIAVGIQYARVEGGSWIIVHNGYVTSNFLGGFPRVGFGFTLGILLQALARGGTTGRHIRALIERIPYPSFALYSVLLAMLLFPKSVRGLYPLVALGVGAPAIVFLGAHIRLRDGFEKNVATFMGWISYPIYCLHYPILRLAMISRSGGHGSAYFLMAIGAALTFALVMLITRWYEEPVRAALGRYIYARPTVPVSKVN